MIAAAPPRAFLLLVLALLAACASLTIPPPSAPDRALLFGHIEGPRIDIRQVYLHQPGRFYAVPLNNPKAEVDENGLFILGDIAPGRYFIAGLSDGANHYWLASASETDALTAVEPGHVVYMGSFRAEPAGARWEDGGEFRLITLAQPDRDALVAELRRHLDNASPWLGRPGL